MTANYQIASDVLAGWRDDVLTGSGPTLYPIGQGELAQIEIGPGLVTLIGGAPGAGKTSFAMQAVVDALRLTESLRVAVCNVEMPASVLLDRQLARLSGIDLATIRHRRLGAEHDERIADGIDALQDVAGRLCFVGPPFDLDNMAATADAFDANLILLDYIQRISPPGQHSDRRSSVNATMEHLRSFADAGVAVVVISAVGRTKDKTGRSSYDSDGLNLASFRESSELEFGGDDCFILAPDADVDDIVLLRHLKARHSEPKDICLRFHRPIQRFTPFDAKPKTRKKPTHEKELSALWSQAAPATNGTGGVHDD